MTNYRNWDQVRRVDQANRRTSQSDVQPNLHPWHCSCGARMIWVLNRNALCCTRPGCSDG